MRGKSHRSSGAWRMSGRRMNPARKRLLLLTVCSTPPTLMMSAFCCDLLITRRWDLLSPTRCSRYMCFGAARILGKN